METTKERQLDKDIETKLKEIDHVQSLLSKKEGDLEDQINDIFDEIASVLEERRKDVIAQLRSRIDSKCQKLGIIKTVEMYLFIFVHRKSIWGIKEFAQWRAILWHRPGRDPPCLRVVAWSGRGQEPHQWAGWGHLLLLHPLCVHSGSVLIFVSFACQLIF